MEYDEVVVKESPGLCRCCLSEGCYKDLGTEYTWMSETEVYAEMLLECFDIGITQHNDGPNGPNRLICEVCITRLRDACNFKKQVLESEKKFIDMIGRGEFRPKVLIYQTQMKSEDITEEEDQVEETEVEYLEDDIDFVDADDEPLKSLANATISEVTDTRTPLRNKRGRPRKNPSSVKTEKKVKVDKEEKPKTSKAMTKEKLENRLRKKRWKEQLATLFIFIIQHSTILPFRWNRSKFMCFYCHLLFSNSSTLKEHMCEHQEVMVIDVVKTLYKVGRIKLDVSDINCLECDMKIQDFIEFLDHISEIHGLEIDKTVSDMFDLFALDDNGMSCVFCGQFFTFFRPLLSHLYLYHIKELICDICGKHIVGQRNMSNHIKYKHKILHCKHCNKTFTNNYAIENHVARFHDTEKWKCKICSEVSVTRYMLTRHMALVHDLKSSRFVCEYCSKLFTSNRQYVYHKRRVHFKAKDHSCDLCGFEAFNKDGLKKHMVKHSVARPYECKLCSKSYPRKSALNRHVKNVHKQGSLKNMHRALRVAAE